ARALEQTLAVSAALSYQSADTPTAPPDQWRRRVDSAYGELRALAATVSDPELQVRIRDAADRLIRDEQDPAATVVHLTAREQDVLALIGSGQSNNTIADGLGIGLYTVKGHVKNLLAKFDAGSRFEVVVKARQCGLLP
ncbi:helix-turn-helix transcriptional regulator, partial [Rhodococcus qingshengii]|uniref:helix-turn-helix transcriptional regulator n=1 Tax=Rhodococcus qingshengii TaxID=334542 RepID=UPI001C136108